MKKIGLLTGGGHISTFHAGMRGFLDKNRESKTIGFINGYKGAEKEDFCELYPFKIDADKAGSILGSTRDKANVDEIKKIFSKNKIDALVVMGGDDHLGQAYKLYESGIPVVGWPKTMDNDLSNTYFCFGFPTAVMVGAQVLKNSFAGAQTHNKKHIVTLFGRNTDWIVACAGTWGLADLIIPCERVYDIQKIYEKIEEKTKENKSKYDREFAVIAVSEGASITGLEGIFNQEIGSEVDVHGNPKLSPMKLALTLEYNLKLLGMKDISIDEVSYEMRNYPSHIKRSLEDPFLKQMRNAINIDAELAREAGAKCYELIEKKDFGKAAVVKVDLNKGRLNIGVEDLKKVKQKRMVDPEGYVDYEKLVTNPNLINYYSLLFGEPISKENVIYDKLRK